MFICCDRGIKLKYSIIIYDFKRPNRATVKTDYCGGVDSHLTGGHLLGLAQGHSFLCRLASSDIRYQTRHHHLFLQMRTTSCQGSQIAIVARLHTLVSCTLCLVHPLSLPHWRSRCDSSGACTACYGRVTWLS